MTTMKMPEVIRRHSEDTCGGKDKNSKYNKEYKNVN